MTSERACSQTRRLWPSWTVAVFLLALCACTASPDDRPSGPVRIGPGLFLDLPRPGDLGRAVDAVQLVTAHYDDQTYVFQSRLSASDGSFTFVGVDMMGRRAMTVTWTDSGVVAEKASWLPAALRPEDMLADMVVIYWPEATLRRSLSGGDFVSSPTSRVVVSGGREMIRVDYEPTDGDPWNGRLWFRNVAWDYALDIRSRTSP